MNNIEELRGAANAIGYEKWADSAGEVTSVDYLADGDATCDHICNCETVNGESANAKFIALANPAAILGLIAQLEAAQKEVGAAAYRIQELESQWENRAPTPFAYDAACSALHTYQERSEKAEAELYRALKGIAELEVILNKPIMLPNGWKLVPIEPTDSMVTNGFESESAESFSDEKVWEQYDGMTGCQQAAHRTKLCWSAMLAAAPQPAGFTVEGNADA